MALENVKPVLDKVLVNLMLDWDRQPGAKDVQRRYVQREQGLPWFAFVDSTGRAVATSNAQPNEQGNVGCPWSPEEIAHFKVMLQAAAKATGKLTAAEIDGLIASLEAFKKKTEGGLP